MDYYTIQGVIKEICPVERYGTIFKNLIVGDTYIYMTKGATWSRDDIQVGDEVAVTCLNESMTGKTYICGISVTWLGGKRMTSSVLTPQERAKHHVVTRGKYSSYRIVAVCSDRAAAEKIVERINRESYFDPGDGEPGWICEECCIEEYEDCDVLFDETLTTYFVNFEKGTAAEEAETTESALRDPVYENQDGTIWGMYVFAKDKEQAMKIASDKRAMLMAQKEGI